VVRTTTEKKLFTTPAFNWSVQATADIKTFASSNTAIAPM